MRLALAFPPPWRISVAPNNQVAAVLPGAKIPDAVVTYGPLAVVPDEPRHWQELVARSEIPAGARVVIGRMHDTMTGDGWPLRLVEAEVRTRDGELLEVRMCAYFTFLEHVGAAIARAQTPEKMSEHGKAILEVLRAGRPEWRSAEPACLARVWDLGLQRTSMLDDDDALSIPERIAMYERQIAETPDSVDSHYNLGQARFSAKEYASALASFERVLELDPADILVRRKVAQCLYALGRDDEGATQRVKLRDAYGTSTNPRVRLVTEFVFDQFDVEDQAVMAVETLRPRDPSFFTLISFRSDRLPHVLVETSDQAKAAGTPYVIGVVIGGKFRAVATLATLPPYPELKKTAIALMISPPTQPA